MLGIDKAQRVRIRYTYTGLEVPVRIYANTTKLVRTLTTKNYPVSYGEAIPSIFSCTAESDVDLTGEKVFITRSKNEQSEEILLVGTVTKCRLNDDRTSRNIEITDELSTILNIDISEWFNTTLRDIKDEFNQVNVESAIRMLADYLEWECLLPGIWIYRYKGYPSDRNNLIFTLPDSNVKGLTAGRFLKFFAMVGGASVSCVPYGTVFYTYEDDIFKNTLPIKPAFKFIPFTERSMKKDCQQIKNMAEYKIDGLNVKGVTATASNGEIVSYDAYAQDYYGDRNFIYDIEDDILIVGWLDAGHMAYNMFKNVCDNMATEHLEYFSGNYIFPYYDSSVQLGEAFKVNLSDGTNVSIIPFEIIYSGSCLTNMEVICYDNQTVYSSTNEINKIKKTIKPATVNSPGLMTKEDKSKLNNIEAGAQVNDIEKIFVNGNEVPINDKTVRLNVVSASQIGQANGIAELDADGRVPSSQLPSYVDEVEEYSTMTEFPVTGEVGKIYIAIDTNLCYRWTGTGYAEISPSIALGETSSTAYRGDRGKTAYEHSQIISGNPHNVKFADLSDKPTDYLVGGSQTSTSTEDEGINTFTFEKADGTTATFNVRNGSKGENATTTSVATTTANGLMSKEDKSKVDNLTPVAQTITIPSSNANFSGGLYIATSGKVRTIYAELLTKKQITASMSWLNVLKLAEKPIQTVESTFSVNSTASPAPVFLARAIPGGSLDIIARQTIASGASLRFTLTVILA